jgi:hypothetical protein
MINPSSFGVLTSTQAFSGGDLQPEHSSFNPSAYLQKCSSDAFRISKFKISGVNKSPQRGANP